MVLFKHKYQQMPDEELMQAIQQGKTAAFTILYDRYQQRIYHFFIRALHGDLQQSQDLVHDTFVRVIEKPHLFDSQKKFSTWIFTIACNIYKNEYRRREVRKNVEYPENLDLLPHTSQWPDEIVEQQLDKNSFESALDQALQQFDPDRRTTFLLRYQQNLSLKEISQILKCAEGTVKSRLFYMNQKLAEELKAFKPG